MGEVSRISPEEARRHVTEGAALLVCAYQDESKCAPIKLEGALTLTQLEARLPSLPKDQGLIFYCA